MSVAAICPQPQREDAEPRFLARSRHQKEPATTPPRSLCSIATGCPTQTSSRCQQQTPQPTTAHGQNRRRSKNVRTTRRSREFQFLLESRRNRGGLNQKLHELGNSATAVAHAVLLSIVHFSETLHVALRDKNGIVPETLMTGFFSGNLTRSIPSN